MRLSIIASAIVMLALSVRAVHADDFAPAPVTRAAPTSPIAATSSAPQSGVYGYNRGEGTPRDYTQAPAGYSAAPQAQPYGYVQPSAYAQQAPYAQPNYQVAQAQPVAPAPQAPYGYNPQTPQTYAPQPYAAPAYAPQPYAPQTYAQPQATSQPYVAPAYGAQQTANAQPQMGQPTYGYRQGDGAPGYASAQPQADPMAYYQQPYATGAPRSNADYQLGPRDKVRITIYGETDLSGEYQIDGTGIVRLPLIGAIRAAGYTAPGLEAWIASTLSRGYLKNPRVNVEITAYRPFYIIGAVNRPGEYPYVDHMSALNAVALAGGFTEHARVGTLYVRHEGSVTEQEVPTDQLSELRPGDSIRVKTTLFWDAMDVLSPVAPTAFAAAALGR